MNPQQTPLTHSFALPCPIVSKTITLENTIKLCSSQGQAQADRVPAAENSSSTPTWSSSSQTAEPDWGKHIESSAASNSLKAAGATELAQIRIKHQYLHGCKLHPRTLNTRRPRLNQRQDPVSQVGAAQPSSLSRCSNRNKKSSNMEDQLWMKSSFPSGWTPGTQPACSLWWITRFPGTAPALSHSIYGQKQASRTSLPTSPQSCCCWFSGKKGFLTCCLLPNKGHLQFIENSWKRLGPNRRKGGREESRASLLRDLLPFQRLPTNKWHLLCPATLSLAPGAIILQEVLPPCPSVFSMKGPIIIIEKKKKN